MPNIRSVELKRRHRITLNCIYIRNKIEHNPKVFNIKRKWHETCNLNQNQKQQFPETLHKLKLRKERKQDQTHTHTHTHTHTSTHTDRYSQLKKAQSQFVLPLFLYRSKLFYMRKKVQVQFFLN